MWFIYSLFFAFWTSTGLLIIKKISKNLNPRLVFFGQFAFLIPFQLLLLLVLGQNIILSANFYLIITIAAILDLIAFNFSFWSIKNEEISLISPIASFNPVFVTIFAMIFLKETPSLIKWIGVIIIVLGAYLLNISEVKGGLLKPFKRLFSNRSIQAFLIANLIWGITPVFQKQAIKASSPMMASVSENILVLLFLTPFILRKIKQNFKDFKEEIPKFLILGSIGSLGTFAAYTAFSLVYIGYASAIFKLSTLFSIIIAGVFLKETNIKERLLGGAVMFLGTILLVI
ncbi:DMT family transporter [Candidatus Daviesbacteria bacterium]|nr:DMT family transporter [Candidatus Daviesbacteria bacterium]